MGSRAILESHTQGVTHPGVQLPPSQPSLSSERLNEVGMLEKVKEVGDDEASRLDTTKPDIDVAWQTRDGVRTQSEQDSERYCIDIDREATFDAKLREPVKRSKTIPEITTEDFVSEAHNIMEKIRRGELKGHSEKDGGKQMGAGTKEPNITDPGLDSSSITQNTFTTDTQFAHLPPPDDLPQHPLSSRHNQIPAPWSIYAQPESSPPQRQRDSSVAFQDSSIDDYTEDYTEEYSWDDIYSANQDQVTPTASIFNEEISTQLAPLSAENLCKAEVAPPDSPTRQDNTIPRTPHSLSDAEKSLDDIPADTSGGEYFLLFPEIHSDHRSDSHDTSSIAPSETTATVKSTIETPSGTSISSVLGDDVDARQEHTLKEPARLADEKQPRRIEEEAAAVATWLAAKPTHKDIYSASPATSDGTSSIQSYNDSVFDDLQSSLSSASSLGDNAQAVFVSSFVDLLIRDPDVHRMIARATSDAGIGVERFRRSFSRILRVYSRDLRDTISQQQRKEHNHQRAATFISRKTTQASSLIATRYTGRVPKPDNSVLDRVRQYLDGLESDHSDSSDEEEAGIVPPVAGLETFLLQGKPFKALKARLRSLVVSNQRVAQVKVSAEHLLNSLFCDLGLKETFVKAQERVPALSTWLRSEFDVLATSLETELKASSPATEYLRIYSDYIAAHAAQKLGQKTNASGTQHLEPCPPRQDKSNMHSNEIRPPEEILEDIMMARLPEVFGGEFAEPTAWARLSATKSFREFASNLSDAAYPTFFSECRKALRAQMDSEAHGVWDQAEERYLLSILMELQRSARQDRDFSLSIECSGSVLWLDRLKLFIERSSGSEWSWWPLSPPPRAESPAYVRLAPLDMRHQLSRAALWLLPKSFRQFLVSAITYIVSGTLLFVLVGIAGYVTVFIWQHGLSKRWLKSVQSHEEHGKCARVISWLCTCGCTRRELVSTKYANLLQQLASKFPMAYYDNNLIQSHGLCVPQTPSPSSSSGSPSSADTQSLDGLDSAESGSSRGSVSTAPSSTGSTTITLDFDRQTFVHLLVRKGDRYVLSPMKVIEKDARGFFQDLIIRYQQQRGFLRRFLSIFVYSHCDFVKVKHHRAYRFSPIPGFSFPEPGRDIEYHEYTYNPRPMIQAPITKHMFNDYFYSCYDSQNMKHAFLHKFRSSCDVIETLPQDLLESMPKRDREVMVGARFGRVEHFWGIVTREQRSALRVILYMLLSLMPTVWFMFMWMFSWGHDGDLQTATVPVTISLATLSMVWIVVYSGGESENE